MRVFITGATGYIGGSVAVGLCRAGHDVAGLTRQPAAADRLARLGIDPVVGSLDDAQLLARQATKADAVINAADSDHRGAVVAFTEALAGSGKPLLHTSGSSVVGDDARGEASHHVFTEADVRPGGSWRPTEDKAARVEIDRLVLAGSADNIRSVVLCNSLIYGHGRGLARDSVQLPRLVAVATATGTARHIGRGHNIWSTVHIDDVVDLYLRALTSALAGSFYFVENGEDSFADMAQAIAETLGLPPAQPWDLDSAIEAWGYEPAVYALGSNSRVRGGAARTELAWAPRHASAIEWIRRELRVAGDSAEATPAS
ncbi:epimerase [Saccharomonospora piscinae]|uniref:Epimerase n=1 Tax=Saccharomonospora piscinae TaxID=687388 RepID=A0A1V9A9N9_SACPI|nr:NAD-dependent epimerase/dehydratase family protein [Saccharomonospora piscinae]OQO93778.1 epimerase [Saccharomonospora piscinae]